MTRWFLQKGKFLTQETHFGIKLISLGLGIIKGVGLPQDALDFVPFWSV
jgi:hypothetical protein